jgi:hypothetical protein
MKRQRTIDSDDETQAAPANKRQRIESSDSSESSSENDKKGGPKWESLEHKGVTFPPAYVPHNVKILFKVRFVFVLNVLGPTNRIEA